APALDGDGLDVDAPPQQALLPQPAQVRRVPPTGNLMHCPDCGLPVSRNAAACPHCGVGVGVTPPPAPRVQELPGRSYRGTASAGFICSLIGIFAFGMILGLIGLVLSACAGSGMTKSGNEEGRGLATAGVVLGIIDMVVWLILIGMLLDTY
ncbi:hypothetical protein LCGC14_2891090, partial [marine sediment metagenome]